MSRSSLGKDDADPLAMLAGGGEMGERTRAFDWSGTPVGPIAQWPQSLKIIIRTMLGSRYAMWLGWGPEFIFFYNDAYAHMTLGPKHPWALGRPAREVWSEIWDDVGPRAESVIRTGKATWDEGLRLFLQRKGFSEETYHTFSYSPVPDDHGNVGGMLCVVTEDTERVIGERRLRTLRELAACTSAVAQSVDEACAIAVGALAGNPFDLPFVLLYLLGDDGRFARRVGHTGLPDDSPACALEWKISEAPWPLAEAIAAGRAVLVGDVQQRFGELPAGAWCDATQQAAVIPMTRPGQAQPLGFVISGVSTRLSLNGDYRGFIELLAGHVAAAVSNVRAYAEERLRAEALAELDRAKTTFFSNVSHEFRTPLTLMLGPVETALTASDQELSPHQREQLQTVHRNGLRLQRLVNALLDFSRIEAGRARAVYEPTDLAALTADLVSNFRSACEVAGLQLLVSCQPVSEAVFVDHAMWEKIILNLLSNAFKFTFEGAIEVSLQQRDRFVDVRVRDTGIGIPAEEIPRLFERFHRVEKARGRTHEGSGIGLALVQELVKLHGGAISIASAIDRGTTFTITLPLGSIHLPADQVESQPRGTAAGSGALPFVQEALRWLPESISETVSPADVVDTLSADATDSRPWVLVADDNVDMRRYIVRLLSAFYRVETVPDGTAALDAVNRRMPDVIITDVMMPRLDGFELVAALRAQPTTASVPIILLSARAGEESRVEGLQAGADDYLVKPFSANELLARVDALLKIMSVRREAERAIRKAEESVRESQSRLESILTASEIGTWEYDIENDRVSADHNLARMFGIGPNNSHNLSLAAYLEAIHPDDCPRVMQSISKALQNEESYEADYRLAIPGAPLRWVVARGRIERDPTGKPVRLPGAVMDVTGQRAAEEELRRSEERRRLALDSAELGAWNIDAVTNKLTTDERFRIILHNSLAPITFENAFAAIHVDDRQRIYNAVTAAMNPQQFTSYSEEYRVVHPDGTIRWVHGRGRANFDKIDGQRRLVSLDGTISDITSRKHFEQDRERLVDELQDQDKRKDEFLATLAHELRNPLAPLRNGLQILQLAGNNSEMAEKARTMMERQLGQMVHLIDDLLDLSRISRGKIELRTNRLDLATIVQLAVETSGPEIERAGHKLNVSLPAGVIFVDADTTRLAQVVSNLLNNSAKYTEPGGTIQLSVRRENDEAVITVRDNGIGIPPEMLPRVFDMFTQVDRNLERAHGGLGIGLSIVKRLVQMHNGTVHAASAGAGLGSEFSVRLPVVLSVIEPSDDDARATHPATGRRILVVDDNRDAAISLAMMLTLMGNETKTAYDGLEALEVAEVFRPDLIMLDIGMPRLNGYDTAARIRQQAWGSTIMLVALTGWGQDDDRRRSRESGFNLHLVKPVDSVDLHNLLARLHTERA